MAIFNYDYVLATLPGLFVGLAMVKITANHEKGKLEGLLAGVTSLVSGYCLHGSVLPQMAVPAIGYSFAWVGHFFFENNKPATFTYPIFSLIGDYRMWYEMGKSLEFVDLALEAANLAGKTLQTNLQKDLL